MIPRRCLSAALAALLGVFAGAAAATAQDLEPKAYSASPVGAAFVVAGLGRATGSVVFDPTLPITDVEAKVNSGLVATGYTFGLFGKLALATAALPYAWGDITGKVAEVEGAISRLGLSDARFKLSINLAGNPAMRVREFVKAPRKTILRHQPDCACAERAVLPRETDQPRDEQVGVQARNRRGGAEGAVGFRRLSWGLAVHDQHELLPRGPDAIRRTRWWRCRAT